MYFMYVASLTRIKLLTRLLQSFYNILMINFLTSKEQENVMMKDIYIHLMRIKNGIKGFQDHV